MRTPNLGLFVLALAACSGDGKDTGDAADNTPVDGDADADADADADTDTDTDTDVPCEATVIAIEPETGARLVPVDQVVTVTYSEPITDAQPWSLEVDGATGTATLAADGLSASWTGTLQADTEYTVNASVCDWEGSSNFFTIAPPVDPALIEGQTYSVAWNDLYVTEPGAGGVVEKLIQVDYIMAQVLSIDTATWLADAYGTVGAAGDTGAIEPACELAVEQQADFTQNPYFSIEGDVSIAVTPEDSVVVEDFSLLARVSEDGTELTQITISGLIATDTLPPPFNGDCYSATIQILSPTCLPCTTSPSGFCMLFEAEASVATAVDLDLYATCAI